MARAQRALTQDVKPAASKAPPGGPTVAVARAATAASPFSRMPSPQVAAAILAGAEKTPRVPEKIPQKKSPAARVSVAPDALPAPPRGAGATLTLVPLAPGAVATPLPVAAAAASGARAPASPGAAPHATRAAAPRRTAAQAEAAPLAAGGAEAPADAKAEPGKADGAHGAPEEKGKQEGTDGKKESGGAKPAADAEGPAAPRGGGGGGAAVALHMPEPPTVPSAATLKRIGGVQHRAGGAAAAKSALPAGDTQVGAARQAVTQPDAEAKAKAQADLIAMLGGRPAPSPEIVKLCQRIREVIRNKRPPDEDALMEAKPEGEALDAGNQLNTSVQSETSKVQGNYGALGETPAGAAPTKGQDLPGQPAAAATVPVNAKAATPDAVPAGNVSLDADAEANKKKIKDAGMETPAAEVIKTGPVAEARGAQGELEKAAKEDPAKVLAGQKEALAKAEDNMAALQQQALTALTTARAGTTKGATSQQSAMVGSEQARRTKASAEAQEIFKNAQTAVAGLLRTVSSDALAEWEAAKKILVGQFKADLAPVQARIDDRHAGVGGFFTGLWDAVAGLPDWAKEGYDKAELNFSEGVIAKITKISVEVNTVIAACELLIKTARDRIAKIFSDLGGGLADWAKQEQAKFDGQLDKLHEEALATRDNFNKDLKEAASQAVDEARTEIAELRKKAGGLVGRILNAVARFIDDPVKFIIEGLLDLLGIPPAAFWAVVAKIKKVVKDIAADPLKFANNLLEGLSQGFGLFFHNFGTHLIKGFLTWLLGDLKGVQVPKDVSVKSIITFFLQLMGITWPNIRKILVKQIGPKNVALIEKVYSLVSLLIEKGPEGIFEMIKEKLDPQSIVDQVVQMAVDFMVSAIIKQVAVRVVMLFNPAGAIVQALEAIYRVLKWIFQNAAKIFTLVETVVNGVADILAGNLGGFAAAVEKGLAMLIAPVISFIADYFSLGDLPSIVADKVKSMQEWILGIIEKSFVWIIEKGKALLAAVGIGKKDKDKDKKGSEAVGEEVGWTVGKESHHLWIAPEGSEYVPMMASEKPHPVKTALDSYGEQAKKLKATDEENAELALKAIARGRKALTTLEKALVTVANLKASPDSPPEHLTKANDAVVAAEDPLREAVTEVQEHLGLDDDERVKKAKAHFGSSPFSTTKGLAPVLEVEQRTAQRIVQAWVNKGIVFRIQSASEDPLGMNTFDPVIAEWRETNPNNRSKYGYMNPKKSSTVGLIILSKGLLGEALASGRFQPATSSERTDADYHQTKAHYKSVASGGNPDFMFPDAILGHKEPGASGHWNSEGHTKDKQHNYNWNQDPNNYQGPEYWEESSASGGSAERYMLPSKEEGSHESWLKP